MYSSPAASGPGSRPASPQVTNTQESQNPAPPGSRYMQVKILYSFDDGNKTNCLARCPQPHSIQTAQLDEKTQIGIIELRLCIQAIVAASPELVAKLGQDYTVYAYDYSEYETPLVGQGMLSWVLASSSATPTAPAHASRTMVTGRVCKNILGLFSSGGASETLEVKLRLVPVPTCLQSEYLESMQKYRDASNQAVEKFDGDAWSSFLRANPGFDMSPPADQSATPGIDLPLLDSIDFDFPSQGQVQHMSANSEYGGQLSPFTQVQDSPFDISNSPAALHEESRSATPVQRQQQHPPSRAASRASNHSQRRPSQHDRRPSLQQQASASSKEEAQPAEPSYIQDGPRKRARIEKTDWRGPPSFETRSDSLLRTASAAASIRNQGPATLHRYPSASEIAAGEIGPRPPTPISKPFHRRLLGRSSMSGGQRPSTSYRSPYALDQDNVDSASIASSPPQRETSVMSTTFDDIPSSPPVIHSNVSVAPSSPGLPPLDHADSGFVSGPLEEYANDNDEYLRPADYEDLKIAAQYKSRSHAGLNNTKSDAADRTANEMAFNLDVSMNMEMPGDPSQLPTSSDPRKRTLSEQKSQAKAKAPPRSKLSRSKSMKHTPSSPRLPPLPLPSDANHEGYAPAQTDPMPPPRYSAQSEPARSRSESFLAEPQSELGAGGHTQKVGSGLKRKRAIEARLRSDIAKGIAPQYCKNCGQIETPTWRKCFVAIVQDVPEDVKISEEEFGIWCIEPMKDEEKGTVINYALIRRSIREEEADQWQETQLCNPCGIHLFKNKRMRPKDKYLGDGSKDNGDAADKPKRARSRKKKTDTAGGAEPMSTALDSELDMNWQLPDMPSGRSDKSIAKTSGRSDRSRPKTTGRILQRSASTGGTQMPAPRRRPGLDNSAAVAALQRAIQSSPPRFPGSKHSPIELETSGSPDPTRRLLFPSPRKNDEMKLLDTSKQASDTNPVSPDEAQMDKENLPPAHPHPTEQDELQNLFSPSLRTPKSAMRKYGGLLKTPNSRTRSSPRRALGDSARRFLAISNPETPSRSAQRAPGASSPEEMTPWTRQLNNLLSDANLPLDSDSFNHVFSDADGAFAFSDFTVPEGMDNSGAFGFALYEDSEEKQQEHPSDDAHDASGPADEALMTMTNTATWDIDELLAGTEA